MTSLEQDMNDFGRAARAAAAVIAQAPSATKDQVLRRAAELIDERAGDILAVNATEVEAAKKNDVSSAFVDRMTLNADRISSISSALREIAAQNDPVGEVIEAWSRPNGLQIERVRTPIGVVAIIYESRPNVTVDAAAICLKAGSAAILRGGSDCIKTAIALHDCMERALVENDLPAAVAQIVKTTDRAAVGEILKGLDGAVDMIVPRGGKSLVARVQEEARAPVLAHLDGLCHVYIDGEADPEKALAITVNSKMRRTGICGAAETLLIDRAILPTMLPVIAEVLISMGCELRGDAEVCALDEEINPAHDDDWTTEYLDAILSIAAVDGVDGAIDHVNRYGSHHTDSIVTEDKAAAEKFLARVDSAIVVHNASTQYADGGEFGLGAEIGIATGRLHARGPVGVRELTTYKNVVRGDGQVRP